MIGKVIIILKYFVFAFCKIPCKFYFYLIAHIYLPECQITRRKHFANKDKSEVILQNKKYILLN